MVFPGLLNNKITTGPNILKPIAHPGPPTPYMSTSGTIKTWQATPSKPKAADFLRQLTNEEYTAWKIVKYGKGPVTVKPLKPVTVSVVPGNPSPAPLDASPRPTSATVAPASSTAYPMVQSSYRDALASPAEIVLDSRTLLIIGGIVLLLGVGFILLRKEN